jgi:sulfatase modifying factor 1
MKHSKRLTQVFGCALMLVLAAACASAAPTPTQVPPTVVAAEPIPTTTNTPPSAPTATVAPTQKPTATASPPLGPQPGATRVLERSGITLVYVPGSEFTMGSSADDSMAYDYEKPVHTVYVDGFWIGQTEVTNAQYRRFVEGGGYSKREYWMEEGWKWQEDRHLTQPWNWDDERFSGPQQPVVNISWHEAAAFAAWAGGRLPTEAEWEYAARGGPLSKGFTFAGSDNADEVAWYYDTSEGHTEPVGRKKPNELGLYDMSGNAWEWCADWYDAEYYAASPRVNPQGPASGEDVAVRGCAYDCTRSWIRCASRSYLNPFDRVDIRTGFRIVVVP